MATNIRIVPRQLRDDVVFISFVSSQKVAGMIRNASGVARRASVPTRVIGRVIIASVARRLQPTPMTALAMEFDQSVAKNNAQVPSFINKFIAGVPIAGQINKQGDTITVQLLDQDEMHILDYINSITFDNDLELLKQFAQAHSLAYVPLDPFQNQVIPSITQVIQSANLDYNDLVTIPYSLRHATKRILKKSFNPDLDKVVQIEDLSDSIPNIVSGRVDPDARIISTRDITELADDSVIYVELHPEFQGARLNEDIRFHSPASDDSIDSDSKAYSTIFPITRIQTVFNDGPDAIDVAFTGRNQISFFDELDASRFIQDAANYIIKRESANYVRSQQVMGTVDTRSGNRNPTPYVGSNVGESQSVQRLPANTDTTYVPNQTFQMGSQRQGNPGLNNPPERNGRNKSFRGSQRNINSRDVTANALRRVVLQILK